MKHLFYFFCVLLMFSSCEKQGTMTSTTTDLELKELTQDFSKSYGQLDQSITNSTWWKDLNPTAQRFLSIELSQKKNPLTYKELKSRMAESLKLTSVKAKVCPGYPIANPEGDVILNSQADVDAFDALNCKEIVGKLDIIDTLGPSPICDLSSLSNIKEVGSSLSINSDCLTTLDGLHKIKSVGELGPFGFVGVIGANLTDITGLSKLKVVTGSINIINCDQLTTTGNAFINITKIESGQTAATLTSIHVLNIDDNALLTDLGGFSNLTTIEGGLRILSNGALSNLDDLSALNSIGEDIFIFENTSLQNVNELSNISNLSDDLFVLDNPALTECCGLFSLLCSDPPACTTSGVGDIVAIFNNGAGCTDLDIIANGSCN